MLQKYNLRLLIISLILLVYAALFFVIPQTEYLPADPGIKILQVKDFINKKYQSFEAAYNGENLDPEKIFFPIKPAGAYKINGSMYYQYPFYLTLIYTPAYLLMGVYGLVLLSLIFGLLTIYMSYKIARQLNISERNMQWMLIFLGFASIIPLYSYFVAEYTLSFFLVTSSIYLVFLGYEKNNTISYFLAGLSAGASVFFRIELGLFCALLLIGAIIFKIYKSTWSQVLALFFSLSICAILLVVLNYYFTGTMFGVREIDFFRGSGVSYTIPDRLLKLFSTFFIAKSEGMIGIGLFFAWPVFILLFGLFLKKNRAEENLRPVYFMFFIITLFFIIIPFVVYMGDGSVIGPRFLSPLQPLLAVITFKVLDLKMMKTKAKEILSRALVVYSIIIIIGGFVILYKFNQISHDINIKIAGHAKNQIVILYNDFLSYNVLPLFKDKIVLAIDPSKDWDKILQKTGKQGVKDYTVIDFAKGRKSLHHPIKTSHITVIDRFIYDGQYKTIIVENIRIDH